MISKAILLTLGGTAAVAAPIAATVPFVVSSPVEQQNQAQNYINDEIKKIEKNPLKLKTNEPVLADDVTLDNIRSFVDIPEQILIPNNQNDKIQINILDLIKNPSNDKLTVKVSVTLEFVYLHLNQPIDSQKQIFNIDSVFYTPFGLNQKEVCDFIVKEIPVTNFGTTQFGLNQLVANVTPDNINQFVAGLPQKGIQPNGVNVLFSNLQPSNDKCSLNFDIVVSKGDPNNLTSYSERRIQASAGRFLSPLLNSIEQLNSFANNLELVIRPDGTNLTADQVTISNFAQCVKLLNRQTNQEIPLISNSIVNQIEFGQQQFRIEIVGLQPDQTGVNLSVNFKITSLDVQYPIIVTKNVSGFKSYVNQSDSNMTFALNAYKNLQPKSSIEIASVFTRDITSYEDVKRYINLPTQQFNGITINLDKILYSGSVVENPNNPDDPNIAALSLTNTQLYLKWTFINNTNPNDVRTVINVIDGFKDPYENLTKKYGSLEEAASYNVKDAGRIFTNKNGTWQASWVSWGAYEPFNSYWKVWNGNFSNWNSWCNSYLNNCIKSQTQVFDGITINSNPYKKFDSTSGAYYQLYRGRSTNIYAVQSFNLEFIIRGYKPYVLNNLKLAIGFVDHWWDHQFLNRVF